MGCNGNAFNSTCDIVIQQQSQEVDDNFKPLSNTSFFLNYLRSQVVIQPIKPLKLIIHYMDKLEFGCDILVNAMALAENGVEVTVILYHTITQQHCVTTKCYNANMH